MPEDGGPPCKKCRREMRECILSDERSWAKRQKVNSSQQKRRRQDDGAEMDNEPLVVNRGGAFGNLDTQYDLSFIQESPGGQNQISLDGTELSEAVRADGVGYEAQVPPASASTQLQNAAIRNNEIEMFLARERAATAAQVQTDTPQPISLPQLAPTVSSMSATAGQYTEDSSPAFVQGISHPDIDVLRVWNAWRFVKMGWLSADDALRLIDLYVHIG